MPQCERTFESPLEAQTSTGPTDSQAICEIGGRLDIKHFVSMKNLRNFPIDVTSFSQIQSEPRLISFALAHQVGVDLTEDRWSVISILDTDEAATFCVSLLSNLSNGTEQEIEVKLVVNRWHEGPQSGVTFPPITILS
jgi:hypothetical protein